MPTTLRSKLSLFIGTIVVTLALAEVVVRFAGIAPGFGAIRFGQHAASLDPILGWTNAPAAEGINSLGLRGEEVAPTKNARRILVLGDSVAFGYGLAAAETIPHQLETALRARGVEAEVLNCGVVAYNSRQEGRWLELHGPSLAPDEVVVVYCLNDTTDLGGGAVPEDLMREAHKHDQKDDWARMRGLPRLSPFTRNMLEHSHLARTVYYAFVQAPQLPVAGNAQLVSKGWSKDFSVVEDGFGRIARYCAAAKIPASVAIMPWLEHLERYPNREQHERVSAIATKLGLRVVDLLPAMTARAKESGKPLALPGDPVHPNADGARVAAETIAAALKP